MRSTTWPPTAVRDDAAVATAQGKIDEADGGGVDREAFQEVDVLLLKAQEH